MGAAASAAEKTTLILVSGGMGTDGATLESTPTEASVGDAVAIYKALKVKPAANGKKKVGFVYDGDVVGLECDRPKSGVHTKTAGCQYLTILNEKPPKNGMEISVGSIQLAPATSRALFNSLNVKDESGRVGATTKQVGNLKCTRAVRPGALAKCELSNVMVTKISIDQFDPQEQANIRKLAKKLGLK